MKAIIAGIVVSLVTSVCAAFPEEDELNFVSQLRALVPAHLIADPIEKQWVERGVDNLIFLQRRNPCKRAETLQKISSFAESDRISVLKSIGQNFSLMMAKL